MKACTHPLKSRYETLILHGTALLSPCSRGVSHCWPMQHDVSGKNNETSSRASLLLG